MFPANGAERLDMIPMQCNEFNKFASVQTIPQGDLFSAFQKVTLTSSC